MKRLSDFPSRLLTNLNWLVSEEPPLLPGLDLGNDQVMSAEDVVDGHARRLILSDDERRAAKSGTGHMDSTDPAEAGQELTSAIKSLAPHLLPYVTLAEQIAEINEPVATSPEFRQLLQDALQAERKQLLNKRAIGIVPKIEPDEAFFQGSATKAAATNALMIVLPLLGALALYLWYRQRNQKNRS